MVLIVVMAGLVPAIHVFRIKTWMPGIKPGMTPVSAGQRGRNRRERSLRFRAIGSASLRHVGPAAATFAAKRLGALFHEVNGVKTLG
jgi:hypothetical protein